MEPITLRLPPDLVDSQDREAEAAGFNSRAEYIRQVLQRRSE